MENMTGFLGLLLIWGALYVGYTVSVKRYQEGE